MIILTFGKYVNSSIDGVSETDPGYLLWLYRQPWLKEKHKEVYNYIHRNKTDIEHSQRMNELEDESAMESWGDRD